MHPPRLTPASGRVRIAAIMTDHESRTGPSRWRAFYLRRRDQVTVVGLLLASLAGMLIAESSIPIWPSGPAAVTPESAGWQIDINQADWPEIAALPMIGEGLAREIVRWRQTHGPFSSTDQLAMIDGIGQTTVERIAPFVALPRRAGEAGRVARQSRSGPPIPRIP